MTVPRHLKVEACISPTDAVRALRQLVIEANWSGRRIQGSRLVDRWAVIVPIAQGARTIGLVIENGPLKDVAMEAYSHVQGSAGALTVIEWLIPNHLEKEWRVLFAQWTARLPRCPGNGLLPKDLPLDSSFLFGDAQREPSENKE